MNIVFDTEYPADSLEFCPIPGFQDIFACGTYKLLDHQEKGTQKRKGQCLVFQMREGNSIEKVQSLDLPAIPDVKWSHRQYSPPLLAVADSEGGLTLLEWHDAERSLGVVHSIQCAPEDTLCLSLDWSNRRLGGSPGSLVVSLSDGQICLLTPSEGSHLEVQEKWHAHDYEPWVAAWNYWDHNVIYSGGDDLKLKAWDIRQGFLQPTFVNRYFDAGITSVQSHPFIEHLIAVGSYDETVRLFDTRKPLIPLSTADVGGGAWRVKWHPSPNRKDDLLVACMHDGFKVVQFNSDSEKPSGGILKRYNGHESLAYGVDWCYAPSTNESVVGCCSFFDHKISLWSA